MQEQIFGNERIEFARRQTVNTIEQAHSFIEQFPHWASTQTDVLAVALVGSYSRNAARENSDVDLVIIMDDPQKYLTDTEWIKTFGTVVKQQIED